MELDIQNIFNKIIAAGLYGSTNESLKRSTYMCQALYIGYKQSVINIKEYHYAKKVISDYLETSRCGFLHRALQLYDLPAGFPDRLAIYMDWRNRPKLGKQCSISSWFNKLIRPVKIILKPWFN